MLLNGILPGLSSVDPSLPGDAQMALAVEANVRWSIHQMLATPEGQARMREGVLKLVGAVYELRTGRVLWLP
jgi:carbonic anhydrase